jgi:SAM-dependent methyltransferase
MKIWIQKAIVQKCISFLPFSQKINFLFQKYVTKGVYLTDAYFEDKISHLHKHLSFYKKHTGENYPRKTLELGTGWYPVIPVGMYLCGSDQNITVDISPLTNRNNILLTLQKYVEWFDDGKLQTIPILAQRLSQVRDIVANSGNKSDPGILDLISLKLVVGDARTIELADGTIDLITSNNTLEHIYPDILKGILRTFYRKLRHGGIMSHGIDMSDHFAHLDKSITIYNYLRFSEAEWKWIDNSVQPQNRLRISQYEELYKELNIPVSDEEYAPGDINALKSVPINAAFKNIPVESLAASHCSIISRAAQ